MSISLEKLISELNAIPPAEQENVINSVPWLKQKLISLIQPNCVEYIRKDRLR